MSFERVNRYAFTYDDDVENADQFQLFPFDGYHEVLRLIASELHQSFSTGSNRVLDLGIGTGKLYQYLDPKYLDITGIDYASKMLEIAAKRIPEATLLLHDLHHGLPQELANETFDAIVATYFFHEFTLDDMIAWINQLLGKLNPFGKIYIGDAMFLNGSQKRAKELQEKDLFYTFDYYHIFDQLVGRMKNHLSLSFFELKTGAAVLVIENYHDCTLQNEEHLVQYK